MSDSDLLHILLEQSDRFFTDLVDRALFEKAEWHGLDGDIWQSLEEFGLGDTLLKSDDEDSVRISEAAAIFTLLGRHGLPLPLGETILARAVLSHAGVAVPEGAIGLAVGSDLVVTDGRVAGSLPHVAHGDQVSHILTDIAGSDGPQLVLLDRETLGQEAEHSIGRNHRATFRADNVAAVAVASWPRNFPEVMALGALLRSSQIAGAAARLLELSVEYANTRKQFGRTIGTFQAVQHMLAQLAAEAAAARAAADTAWLALEKGNVAATIAVAKLRAAMAARKAAAIAHQVHGAIGFTDEHILHNYSRRMMEWQADFGGESYWARHLYRDFRASGEDLWGYLITACTAKTER